MSNNFRIKYERDKVMDRPNNVGYDRRWHGKHLRFFYVLSLEHQDESEKLGLSKGSDVDEMFI